MLLYRAAAAQRTAGDVTAVATRYTFFRSVAPFSKWEEIAENDVLGYAVVLHFTLSDNTHRIYVLEAATRIPALWLEGVDPAIPASIPNQYIHCCRAIKTTLGMRAPGVSRELQFTGTYFYQQNDLTHVCAHAALRTAINTAAFHDLPKLTNAVLNKMLGIDLSQPSIGEYVTDPPDPVTGKVEAKGVGFADIPRVIEALGFKSQAAQYATRPDVHFTEELHAHVESGCPTILATWNGHSGHVVAVLGHTLNSDRWSPEARIGYGAPLGKYLPAAGWTDHLVISDDNYGMYVTLPPDQLRIHSAPVAGSMPSLASHQTVVATYSVTILPPDVHIQSYLAEQYASHVASVLINSQLATAPNDWLKVFERYPITIRTLLQSKQAYMASMGATADQWGNRLSNDELATIDKVLPSKAWVSEISVPHLFAANKRKLGDVVICASEIPGKTQFIDYVVLVWLPSCHWLASDLVAGTASQSWSIKGHVPLSRGSGPKPKFEW